MVEATVHGAISMVNAIATGKGATMGIDTYVKTRLETSNGAGIHISSDNKTISSRLINRVIEKIVTKTELEKTKQDFIGTYDTTACAELYGQYFQGITTDHMLELNQRDKERIFNLGYYTWVEQQGVDLNHFEARRHQSFWDKHLQKMLDLDEQIDKFNNL